MDYVYPALFCANADGSYTVTFPDLPGCITEGKSLENGLAMAQSALSQWVEYLIDEKQPLPRPSAIRDIRVESEDAFATLVRAEVKDGRAVKRTVSLPKWMDDKVIEAGLSLSRVLQDALSQRFR